jgi:hypothetical protein
MKKTVNKPPVCLARGYMGGVMLPADGDKQQGKRKLRTAPARGILNCVNASHISLKWTRIEES